MSDVRIFSTPTGWAIVKDEISVICSGGEYVRVVKLEIPFDELDYEQVSDLIEMLWRARAWIRFARGVTNKARPPLSVEPPSTVGYARALKLFKEHGAENFEKKVLEVIQKSVTDSRRVEE